MSTTFRIGNLIPAVKPRVGYNPMVFGENFRGQAGSLYSSINGIGLTIDLEFERLTHEEALTLEYYCTRKPSSAYSTLEMEERDNVFDGSTYNSRYGRILNKVKIVSWSIEPFKYKDGASLERAQLTVEET